MLLQTDRQPFGTYQHKLQLNYAEDHMGTQLVQIFQSLMYMMLNWSDTNGTLVEMNWCRILKVYHLMVALLSEYNFDTIPVEKKNNLNFNKHSIGNLGSEIKYNLCVYGVPVFFFFNQPNRLFNFYKVEHQRIRLVLIWKVLQCLCLEKKNE